MNTLTIPAHDIGNKIAAFDLDYTLVGTASGRRFPKDKDDWKLMFESIQGKLKKLCEDGYSIIIFTNQKNLEKRIGINNFKAKCENIQTKLDVPMTFYISHADNGYLRKPFPGMFEYHNKCYPVSLSLSFYVGDAWDKKKCFSDSDLCFARNCGLSFYKAKEYFENDCPIAYNPLPRSLFSESDEKYVKHQLQLQHFLKDKQYLFLIGPPATGKTTFCKKYLPDYIRLSKDDYSTQSKYRNAISDNIDEKIVFDNTNYSEQSRDKLMSYLPSCSSVGYIVRNIPKSQSLYLNQYRHFITKGQVKSLPTVAIHTYYKRVDIPFGDNVFIMNYSWIFQNELKSFCC